MLVPHIRSFFLLFCLASLCTACALKVRPDGGPPDTVPAFVVETDPVSGTRSFKGTEVTFVFDDYVDRSIRSAITVLPITKFNSSYAGNEITVSFDEDLKSNTTYSVTIGTSWKDRKGNTPLEAYSMIFSTGEHIDSGVISCVVMGKTLQDASLFCYAGADTLTSENFSSSSPAYVLPIGTSGAVSVRGLPDGLYRLVAVRDENKSRTVDPNEHFATAWQDAEVKNGLTNTYNFMLAAPFDVQAPQLLHVRALSNTRYMCTFSETIVLASNQSPVSFTDSTGNSVMVKNWWISPGQPEALIVITDSLPLGLTHTIEILGGVISDTAANVTAEGLYKKSVRPVTVRDTTSLIITRATPKDSATNVSIVERPALSFSDAVDTSTVKLIVSANGDRESVPVRARWKDPSSLLIEPLSPLPNASWLHFKAEIRQARSVIGSTMPDTTVQFVFYSADRIDSGTITGVFADSARFGGPYLIQFISKNGAVGKEIRAKTDGAFSVPAIEAGDYTVRVIQDLDDNGRYYHGSISPFKFSEKWVDLPVSLRVKKRWTLEDVSIVIPR